MSIFKAMKQKKKRAVNPDIPRPNLFTHEKRLKDMTTAAEKAMHDMLELRDKVRRLERKLASQTDYLQAVHSRIYRK
jgi:hypothetical protein